MKKNLIFVGVIAILIIVGVLIYQNLAKKGKKFLLKKLCQEKI